MAFMYIDNIKTGKWYNAFAKINKDRDLFIIKYEDKHWYNANGDLTTPIGYNDQRITYDDLDEFGMPNFYYEDIKLSRNGNQIIIKSEENDTRWYNTIGQLHRDGDLPAIEFSNGNKEWYRSGLLHRENDLPAFVSDSGTKEWYINGEQHRDNDLPAIEKEDGSKIWKFNGASHRLGGLPAVDYGGENQEWYINDEEYTYEQVCKYYKILTRFGRYCLRKIRMRSIKSLRCIHRELLCMPAKGRYPGGMDSHKVVNYFMSM